ncbi:MAG: glycosyltransferase, partial [Dehalococcoidales bacterium]|nr:glycosyltransferase [Dehalococcoidales bacterium]
AEVMCRLSDHLCSQGLRDRAVMFWNANNTFSFQRIDWKRLKDASTITTVSRYMKHIMWRVGVNPLVIPNGIPRALLNRIDEMESARLRARLNAEIVMTKVARWDPDKRWNSAVESVARLKSSGLKAVLLARGGLESHGAEVLENAHALGLKVRDVTAGGDSLEDYLNALENNNNADILNIKFHCPQDFLRLAYNASDAVLANSGHEPFGLVGLESMAARGVAFTGGTGEDYAIPFQNSIVLETSDPREIEAYVMYLKKYPEEEERLRKAAWSTARRFAWEEIIQNLIQKLEYQARIQESLVPV